MLFFTGPSTSQTYTICHTLSPLSARPICFSDLAPELRAEVLTLFKPRSAVPGERLIRAGDVAREVFFISSGAVEVSVGDQKIRLEPRSEEQTCELQSLMRITYVVLCSKNNIYLHILLQSIHNLTTT